MAAKTFDRSAEDVGNIVHLEHCNVRVPDQVTATRFYVMGMGFTRDPYMNVGTENMWINIGQQQLHLPTGEPQVFPGPLGVVVPSLSALTARLEAVREKLRGTAFDFVERDKCIMVTCPWGNRFRCHQPGPEFRDMTLGVPYVEFPVKPGYAPKIARFYETAFGAPAPVASNGNGQAARVCVGTGQTLVFQETTAKVPPYDGHHIAVYLANFSGPHKILAENGLITEESNQYQYRFKDIIDCDSKEVLFTIEHEVRSFTHPMYMRAMPNRNAAQTQREYHRGRDAFVPGME